MLLQVYIICFCIFLTEANKIGLVGRSNEEQSSLRTEIMKYKSSECGGSSSEESHEKSKKNHKKNSDQSDSSESEEDQKKKHGKGRNNSSRNKYNRSNNRHRDEDDSNSREYGNGGYSYGQPSPGGYPDRRPGPDGRNPYQQNPYQDPYQSRNPNFPGRPTNGQYPPRGGMPYPSTEQGPFHRPGGNRPYGGRPEVSYPDRETGGYGRYPYQNGRDQFQNGDMYSGTRDSFQNRGGSASREYGRGSHRSGESHGHSKSHGSKRKNKKPSKNESSDEECTSQCVFNNMDIMEDDGIPSESAMIKWAQDKIKNEKLKTAAVKEIRKCFGSLASSDGDNSCNFSKSLASCLKLDLDEE